MDVARSTISSIQHTGHYDLDAFLTSILYPCLPTRVQTLWEQHSIRDKGVPPVNKLLTFVREHAETLPANPSSSGVTPEQQEKKSNNKKPFKKQDSYLARQKANIHVATPTSTYSHRWECLLCKPERHPLPSGRPTLWPRD